VLGEKIVGWAKHLLGVEPSPPGSAEARATCDAKPVGQALGDTLEAFGALTRSLRAARGKGATPAREHRRTTSGRASAGRAGSRTHTRTARSPRRAGAVPARVRPVPPPPPLCEPAPATAPRAGV
jgi:hypothetical protein